MRFIELHDHYGEPIALEPGMITVVQAAEQDKHPTRRAVLHLRNNQMRAISESYAEVMALVRGTATAEQEAAERADLDERLASIERHLERIDSLSHLRAVAMNDLAVMVTQQGDRIKQVEESAAQLQRCYEVLSGQVGRLTRAFDTGKATDEQQAEQDALAGESAAREAQDDEGFAYFDADTDR